MPMSPRTLRPGGVFTPRIIPGLAAWYDASNASSITLNSTTVSQWNDLSGNGRHQTQGTALIQPNYVSSGLNGRPVIQTTGTQWMQAAAFTTPASGEYSVFCVMKFDSVVGQPYLFQRGAVNDAHSVLVSSANTWAARRQVGNQGTLSQTILAGTWYAVSAVFTADLSRIFVGQTQGTDNTASVTAPTGDKVLTLFALDSATRGGQPSIAEFIYCHSVASASIRSLVARYFLSKWGV
jgi:hypothetical protein